MISFSFPSLFHDIYTVTSFLKQINIKVLKAQPPWMTTGSSRSARKTHRFLRPGPSSAHKAPQPLREQEQISKPRPCPQQDTRKGNELPVP